MNMMITADRIGIQTGGGLVTSQECQALQEWSGEEVQVFSGDQHSTEWECVVHVLTDESKKLETSDPWIWDNRAVHQVRNIPEDKWPKIVHLYAGTFGKTVNALRQRGSKATYTAAAHSITVSRREHEKLGIPFNYDHINNPELWKRYLQGYLNADRIICPSSHSKQCMIEHGVDPSKIRIIPHGVHLPEEPIKPLPERFRLGYLGAIGPDKGLPYLIQAWKTLNYKDATLVLAGRDSTSPYMRQLIHHFGGGNIELLGWVKNVADFYNSISVYVQPSATEGFGCEVLEAMAYGRPVICSDGAGAVDCVDSSGTFKACDVTSLAEKINQAYWVSKHDLYPMKDGKFVEDPSFPNGKMDLTAVGKYNRELAESYTWDIIKQKYKDVWTELSKEIGP